MKTSFSLNKAAWAGLVGSAIPLVFWIAVACELLFRNTFLMDRFFTPIDQRSSFYSILLLVIIPSIVLLWNFFTVFRFGLDKRGAELHFTATLRLHLVNISVVLFTAFNVLLSLAYALTENFMFLPRY